jgi:hypothetical protein
MLLRTIGGAFDPVFVDAYNRLIQEHRITEGVYAQTPDKVDSASHDNTTAMVSLSKWFGLDMHKQLKILGHYWHPRDILYYSYCKGGWRKLIAWPFMWLHSFFMIFESMTHYRYIPTFPAQVWGLITTFKWTPSVKLVKTDIELLDFIKFYTVKFPLTEKICNYFLKKRFGNKPYVGIFKTYFQDKDHPNNFWARRIWDAHEF